MQITAWYIIPGEDTNKQFFLSCFQVDESSLYFALILCCLWFSISAVSPFTLSNRCCPCLQRPRSFFSACLERQRVLFCQLQFPRGANHVVLHGQDFPTSFPGSLSVEETTREAEERDPGNEVEDFFAGEPNR